MAFGTELVSCYDTTLVGKPIQPLIKPRSHADAYFSTYQDNLFISSSSTMSPETIASQAGGCEKNIGFIAR